ncbi:MAG: Uma2 family endonuclease [Leptolyngbyaceae cyanobacterium SM1_1_3]|nr:Uma2 family endonuclease [Leptolyngbyaceae cyanobacterium SM1_1_3]NJN02328.1 Uma2 family endonuclease [Leptolyngbyaceae cyanobacterium RM1_1_2]NJO10615.1 Uma2 family endonuclease [Leptolyngbyaceae cyanobacterium SL_1_1]
MVQSLSTSLTFDQFIAQYGDDTRYELIDGELIDMEPTGPHEQVSGLINLKLNLEISREQHPFFIPMRCLIKPMGLTSAFKPDIVVLSRPALESEPLWQREPIITLGSSIRLVVEVVSTNWQNDYARKADEYWAMGISEYWICDYLGLGGVFFIGSPKQPTITICTLQEERCTLQQFRGEDQLVSSTFPNLRLAASEIFSAGS